MSSNCRCSRLQSGIALATLSEALPFLKTGQVLTTKGLALLVLNAKDEIETPLPHKQIRFAATCVLNHEPVLLNGTLAQLGKAHIDQFRSEDVPMVQHAPVACARVSVFRDQWEGAWEVFSGQPVKLCLQRLLPLQTCSAEDCECIRWHPVDEEASDVLLDVFRRQFFNDSGKPVNAEQATHFSFTIRYAKAQEVSLLKLSGVGGVFIEPRTEDAMQPSDNYHVVWLPHLDFQQVQHRAQCEPQCLGLARRGPKYGVRVCEGHFQQVFCSLKPDALFLPPGPRSTWSCGPWPYGADRKSLAKVFKQWAWNARPMQPSQAVAGGIMWIVQAVSDPPQATAVLPHGQIVITKCDKPQAISTPDASVICQSETLRLCEVNNSAKVDPLQVKDPWQAALSQAAPAQQPQVTTQLQELEARLERSLLAKLPAEKMEVDDHESRLMSLETQMQQLASRQQAVEVAVQDHQAQSSSQMQSLQAQLMSKLELQNQNMQQMFAAQTATLEGILAKKGRYD